MGYNPPILLDLRFFVINRFPLPHSLFLYNLAYLPPEEPILITPKHTTHLFQVLLIPKNDSNPYLLPMSLPPPFDLKLAYSLMNSND